MNLRIIALLCIPSLMIQLPILNNTNKNKFKRTIKEVQLSSFKTERERFNNLVEEAERIHKEKVKKEEEKLEQERLERKKKEDQEKKEMEQRNKNISKKKANKKGKEVKFNLSFYTTLPCENGGYTVTATGESLKYGVIASNVYKIGTKIHLEGMGDFVVKDRGGAHFNSPNRLDVLIPRKKGESDSVYKKRVNKLGRPTVKGWIR